MSPLRLGPDGQRRIDPVLAVCVTVALVAVLGFLVGLFALAGDNRPDLTGLFAALAAAVPGLVAAGIAHGTRRLVVANTDTTNQRVREAAADAVAAVIAPAPTVPIKRATDRMTETQLAAVAPADPERRATLAALPPQPGGTP